MSKEHNSKSLFAWKNQMNFGIEPCRSADTLCYAGGGGRSSISGHKPHTADRDAQRATRRREVCGMMDKQRMLAPRERQEESIKGGGGS